MDNTTDKAPANIPNKTEGTILVLTKAVDFCIGLTKTPSSFLLAISLYANNSPVGIDFAASKHIV